MGKNANLHKAKVTKNDEFYTRYEDIDKEIQHYRDKLKGLIVYCPCDDFRWSNFVKYFKDKFEYYGLKGLVATNYDIGDGAWKYEYDGVNEHVERLEGNGDFRSEECIEFLKEADVVVTNPPFSLFREYVKQLMDYGKKFIIVGPCNATHYKEIFPYIKEDKLWWGASKRGLNFLKPNGDMEAVNALWFTNVENKKRNTPIDLYKRYSNEYKHYDNYDAIEVGKTCDIPMDYDGVMGVPETFLDKYCPKQFEILWQASGNTRICCPKEILSLLKYAPMTEDRGGCTVLDGKRTYTRIFIRKRNA